MSIAVLSTRRGEKTISMLDVNGIDYASDFVDQQLIRQRFEIYRIGSKLALSEFNLFKLIPFCSKVAEFWRNVQNLSTDKLNKWEQLTQQALQVQGDSSMFPLILGHEASLQMAERILKCLT